MFEAEMCESSFSIELCVYNIIHTQFKIEQKKELSRERTKSKTQEQEEKELKGSLCRKK